MADPQLVTLAIGSPDVWNYVATGPTIDQGATGGPRENFTAANDCLRMKRVQPPGNYVAGGALVLKVIYSCASATTGTVVLACDIDCKSGGTADNFSADDYDTVNTAAADTVPDAITKAKTISLALVNRDGMALGDEVRVRWGFTSAGTATGLIQARDAWLEYTPA